jgi:trehalose 6-phosphate synthase
MADPGVILASNRGPVTFSKTNGGFETARGAGGLAAALDSVARELGERAVWIAATTSDIDREALAAGEIDMVQKELGYRLQLLDIDPDIYRRYYDVVSNRMLWFANHCLWDELDIREFGEEELHAWETAYDPVNKQFARAVAEATEDASIVLFQDYHLSAAPRFLREARPDETIGHFTHSSFCGPFGLDRLPRPIPREVIEGMLGADIIGFHVKQWADGFIECAARIGADINEDEGYISWQGRRVWIRAYPIPIDAEELRTQAKEPAVQRWAERFRHEGQLLVRADRAEPSKNIVRGFEAFGRVLDRRADLASSTRFVACLYPSRETMPEYRRYSMQIREAAKAVNARHPGSVELFLEDDFERTLGALLVYDALLVNPLMDGMNLVSKEGPAVNENDGVLILSSKAGSHAQLAEHAFTIEDPFDVDETARAIETALDAPRSVRASHSAAITAVVERGSSRGWIQAQINDLLEVSRGNPPVRPPAR